MKFNKKKITSTIVLAILILIISVWMLIKKNENEQNPIELAQSSIENIHPTPQGTFERAWRIVKNNYVDKSFNHQNWKRWEKHYSKEIKTEKDAYVAIESMLESLNDPYSRFLSPDEFEDQDRGIESKLYGIGVHISEYKGNSIIVNVIEDTPAAKSGLKAWDRILKVDNKSTKGLSLKEVADAVRGKEGTKVTLELLRNKKHLTKTIVREEIKLKSVKSKVLDKKYAYIRISTFLSNNAAYETLEAIYKTNGSQGIILDLRGNHGGLLPNAINIANMFIKKGDIVSIVNRNSRKQTFKANPYDFVTSKPMVVLVDNESASASEILAGALKDHKRAALIGDTTFGKGLVQRIMELPDGSGVNITIAKYLTPNGHDIGHKGIEPDYKVEMTAKDFIKKGDIQLAKAKKVIEAEIQLNKTQETKSAHTSDLNI